MKLPTSSPFMINLKFLIILFVLTGCNRGTGGQSNGDGATNSNSTTLQVKHYQEPCVGENIQMCYLIEKDGQEQYFYSFIEGFDYEWGYTYQLSVKIDTIAEPLQDASSLEYTLKEVIEKTAVPDNTRFELPLKLMGTTLVQQTEDGCDYYYTIGIDPGAFSCEALMDASAAVFEHADGRIRAVELK